MEVRFVDLDGAEPDEAVVVVDVLRAFTVVPWTFARGAARVLAVAGVDEALRLRDERLADDGALVAGEVGGAPPEGFDLGNSPAEVARTDLTGRTVVHRTSAGTQGLARCDGSGVLLAASFVVAGATAATLAAAAPARVTFVITGASFGRDGDEDRACAELIAARVRGEQPDPAPFTARVATSDAGRAFRPGGPDWAPPEDLVMACEVDRFDHALTAAPVPDLGALEVRPLGRHGDAAPARRAGR